MTAEGVVWVELSDALALHERVLAAHGGLIGVRDQGLLDSALARPKNLAAYTQNAGIVDLAGAYTAGILQNHPFVDGNKRTGFIVGVLFLEVNGHRFTAAEDEAAEAVIGLAAGHLDEAGYTRFLRQNTTR